MQNGSIRNSPDYTPPLTPYTREYTREWRNAVDPVSSQFEAEVAAVAAAYQTQSPTERHIQAVQTAIPLSQYPIAAELGRTVGGYPNEASRETILSSPDMEPTQESSWFDTALNDARQAALRESIAYIQQTYEIIGPQAVADLGHNIVLTRASQLKRNVLGSKDEYGLAA